MYTVLFGRSLEDPDGRSLLSYWEDHHDVPIPNSDNVDWMAFGDARQQLSMGLNRWVSKFWSGHIGVGHMLSKRGWQTNDACPLCHKGPEKSSHVLTCQQVDAKKLFQEKIKKE